MTPLEFRQILGRLLMSQSAMARYLGITHRTINRYASQTGKIPPHMAILFRLLDQHPPPTN